MTHAYNKADRLRQVENLLMANAGGLTQSEIALRLGVNRSTINRYLPDLDESVYVDDDGHWKIDRSADLIALRLNLHEALAVHLAARLLATRMDRQNLQNTRSIRGYSPISHLFDAYSLPQLWLR